MNPILKPFIVTGSFILLMGLADAPLAPHHIGFIPQAAAIIGAAPGGSVVRRRVVVTAASSTANANAAATANANAAAAAAKPPPPPPPAGPPAVGSMTTTLPAGCQATALNGVSYQRCGSTYYKPQMMGPDLVFVVVQP
jgi:hypothetical protein